MNRRLKYRTKYFSCPPRFLMEWLWGFRVQWNGKPG